MSDTDSTFVVKNEWQIRQRNTILKPFFYDRYFPGKYRFLDSNNPAERYADTLVQMSDGTVLKVEEKIVHWPMDKFTKQPREWAYTAFALETWTCTTPGWERQGWMHTSTADILIYAFSVPKSEIGLDCYTMNMQPLKQWFWSVGEDAWAITRTDESNHTECRVVPIADVTANVAAKRYLIGPGWPDSRFCEVCCVEGAWGFPGSKWYCREHKPK
jgi:hypothetical protein